ncbi:MAG: DUF1499 domain-containing protein [Gemmatimonadota bacterium]|nr:DUF1499 domain-containing protein [Gemmatimonadota bacterium]
MGSERLQRWQLRLRTNDVETGESDAYPDVQPLELDIEPDTAWRMARAAAEAMPRWTILDEDPGSRRIRAEATTPVLRFTDDVWIRVEPCDGGSRVYVRSASRIGVTDFGTNARRIRDYLSRLARTEPDG